MPASNHQLTLAKTHDHCASKPPQLTVVMIHGIASNSLTYAKALEHLEQDPALAAVRFVTFDLLGSGKSLKNDTLTYDYHDQLTALHHAIKALNINTPLVLVGHSLGTFIVTRYTSIHPDAVKELVLLSPPVFTPEDLANPAFAVGIKAFKDSVALKNRDILNDKSFQNSMDKIVLAKDNYQTLASLNTPTTLIYGELDQLIASYNIPGLLTANPNITAIKTTGRHGITQDKYTELAKIIKGVLDA